MNFIKECYRPIQPSIMDEAGAVSYIEKRPTESIQNFVHCFWQLKTSLPLEQSFVYRVVSDGCIDIFFEHNDPSESFIMGFCRKYTEFPLGKEFDYIGIRFLPSAFSVLFGVNAKELSNQSQELKSILPEFTQFIGQQISTTHSLEKIVLLLNGQIVKQIQNRTFDFDVRFYGALELIFKNKGCLDTETELNTGISSRQLRRLFSFYIGTSPKAFSKVVRFQYMLNANPSKQSLKESKLYLDLGYFDQAHFIKDFKQFYGVTPAKAFL